MLEKFEVVIPQLTGKRVKRNVFVYVPDEAYAEPENDEESEEAAEPPRYPVLYMFDGHNVFEDEYATYGKSWGMKRYMDETGTPVIIVGIECSHAKNHGRLSEYSPFTFDDPEMGHIFGRGKLTMEWIVNELKPRIDAEYPTLPDRETTWIAGSSMGGLMTLYAVSVYNHVFSRGAALSPSIWVSPKRVTAMVREAEIAPDTVVYMDYGSREFQNHPTVRRNFYNMVETLLSKDVLLTSRIVPNGDHCEACWEEQLPFFMNTLCYTRE